MATVAKMAVITEEELAAVQALRARREQLGRELGAIQAQLTAREDDLVAKVQAGARVRGALTAVLDTKVVCNPSYKDELVAHFEQAHGVNAALVEEEVRKRWRREKIVLVIGEKLR